METALRRKNVSTLHTVVALADCEKTIAAFLEFNGSYVWDKPGLSSGSVWSIMSIWRSRTRQTR